MSLYCLVYTSIANQKMSDDNLKDLLKKVKIIYKKPIEERSFPNWTMGFNKISDENVEAVEGFSDFWQRPISEFFSESPSEIEKMLEQFLDMFKHETLF